MTAEQLAQARGRRARLRPDRRRDRRVRGRRRARACKDFIAIDMGGTSYEACLVRGGQPDDPQLLELAAPLPGRAADGRDALDRRRRRLDRVACEAGALHVGPESAKADPGPICYGRGGTRPTVTDANLVLGYINPEALCGGEFKLDAGRRARGDPRAGRRAARARRRRGRARHLPDREREHGQRDPARRRREARPRSARLRTWWSTAATARSTRRSRPRSSASASCWCRRPRRRSRRSGLLIADYIVDRQRSYIAPSSRAVGRARERALRASSKRRPSASSRAAASRARDLEFRRFVNLCYPGPDLRHGGARASRATGA